MNFITKIFQRFLLYAKQSRNLASADNLRCYKMVKGKFPSSTRSTDNWNKIFDLTFKAISKRNIKLFFENVL